MIIFTCITNGYDEIPDDHYYDPDVQYVCYTDGTVTHKGAWEFREIPIESDCPLKLSLYPKIMINECFPIGSQVVWIDGCYLMNKKWVEFSKKLFESHPRTHMIHPNKFSYLDEIIEGYMAAFNTREDVIKITKTAKEMGFDFKNYGSPILASNWQTVTDSPVQEKFQKIWWEFSQISTRCDQIGFEVAKQLSGLEFNTCGFFETGGDFTGVGGKGRVGRKKIHPRPGDREQYMNRDKMLKEVAHMTCLPPKIYAKVFNERTEKGRERLNIWLDYYKKF